MSDQRVAVVTGTSTGFGYLTALKLAAAGITVFATMRDAAGRNAKPKAELDARGITVLDVDVTDGASVDAAAATVLASAGRVDYLINNAGTAHFGLLETHTPESLERQFATNVVGPHRINRAFLPAMRERGSGFVVFVSSVVGRFVLPFVGIYSSSKWALEAQAETLAYELRPLGIDVSIVEPGAFATNIINATLPSDDPARAAGYGERTAALLAQLNAGLTAGAGDAQDVADAILALVQSPAGTRPLRLTVPAESPAAAINAATQAHQRGVLDAFGFSELLPAQTVSV